MARILYVWELGGDYGHIGSFMPLAHELRKRGHEVIFAIRDLSNAEAIVAKHKFALLQAPIWTADIKGLPNPPLNYTEIIIRYGFIKKTALSGLNRAWISLFSLIRPSLIIADHSPVALFSARACGIPRVTYGTGFCAPPRMSPMPNMRPWVEVPQKRLEEADRHVIQIANSLLKDMRSKAPPLKAVADLFHVQEDFLCTFPELDHYPQRRGARYWGPVFNIGQGDTEEWPQSDTNAKRIFAYIKPNYQKYEEVLNALNTSTHSVLVFSPGASASIVKKYSNAHMKMSTNPLNISALSKSCDLAICHAGHGTLAAMLLAGIPLLLLPTQLEQYLASIRVRDLGAGLLVNLESNQAVDFSALIEELLSNPKYMKNAHAFASKQKEFDATGQFESMGRRIEEILSQAKEPK